MMTISERVRVVLEACPTSSYNHLFQILEMWGSLDRGSAPVQNPMPKRHGQESEFSVFFFFPEPSESYYIWQMEWEHGRSPPGVQGIRGALSVENLKTTTELSTSQSAIISIANNSQQRQW